MTREDAIKVLRTESVEIGGNAVIVCRFLEALDMAVKALDAVPVVRCRECHCYTPVDDHTGKCIFLIGKHQYVVPDGYCYLGERKEGADNDT